MQHKIQHVLISVYHKDGLAELLSLMAGLDMKFYSTGGTYDYIVDQGFEATRVEELTGYPSILDGRVKTLHPMIFGGILARDTPSHQSQMQEYDIPSFDAVIVDLYPFEDSLASGVDEQGLIEKIDIGGISLIRAAAKNYERLLTISSKDQYGDFADLLRHGGVTDMHTRRRYAGAAFELSAAYDAAIGGWMRGEHAALRYGENPHQEAFYQGRLSDFMTQLQGKDLSYNNMVDIDAAVWLMKEFHDERPTIAIIKHTNACGLAQRDTLNEAWDAALAGDPVSAYGGIFISNKTIDLQTAQAIDELFYEVLIAPRFEDDALALLSKKTKRILMQLKRYPDSPLLEKSCLGGRIIQDADVRRSSAEDLLVMTNRAPDDRETADLLFAEVSVKHLKSNGITLVKDQQVIGMGCGQTSRIDALSQAIDKAKRMGFDPKGAVMASDAFFPFADCVTLAHKAGVTAVLQPGGSIRDEDSVTYCDTHGLAMVKTGVRHFRH